MKVEIFKHIDDGNPLRVYRPFTTLVELGPRVYVTDMSGELFGVIAEPSAELLRELLKFGYSSGTVYLK